MPSVLPITKSYWEEKVGPPSLPLSVCPAGLPYPLSVLPRPLRSLRSLQPPPFQRSQRIHPHRQQAQRLRKARLQLRPNHLQPGPFKTRPPIPIAARHATILFPERIRARCLGRQILLDDDPATLGQQRDQTAEESNQACKRQVVEAPLVVDQIVTSTPLLSLSIFFSFRVVTFTPGICVCVCLHG